MQIERLICPVPSNSISPQEETYFKGEIPWEIVDNILNLYKKMYGSKEILALRVIHSGFNNLITRVFIKIACPPEADPCKEFFDYVGTNSTQVSFRDVYLQSKEKLFLKSLLIEHKQIFEAENREHGSDEEEIEYYLNKLKVQFFHCSKFKGFPLGFLNRYRELLESQGIPFKPRFLELNLADDLSFDSFMDSGNIKEAVEYFNLTRHLFNKHLKKFFLTTQHADFFNLTEGLQSTDRFFKEKTEEETKFSRLRYLLSNTCLPGLTSFYLDFSSDEGLRADDEPDLNGLDIETLIELCPNLTHLSFNGCILSKCFIERLVESELLCNLEVLHLRNSVIEDLDSLCLLLSSDKLSNLVSLHLPYLTIYEGNSSDRVITTLQQNKNLSSLVELAVSDPILSYELVGYLFNFLILNTSLKSFKRFVGLACEELISRSVLDWIKDTEHLNSFDVSCLALILRSSSPSRP